MASWSVPAKSWLPLSLTRILPAYVGQRAPGQVDAADAHAPGSARALLVPRRDRGPLGLPLGAGSARGAAPWRPSSTSWPTGSVSPGR